MGIGLPFFKPKSRIKASNMVALTTEGKNVADSARGQDYLILSSLEERSPKTVREIAKDTDINVNEVGRRLETLMVQRMVSIVGLDKD